MVYKLSSEGIGRGIGGKAHTKLRVSNFRIPSSQSVPANILIHLIKIILFIYDIVSYPVYFILQRPDIRLKESQKFRLNRDGPNTWSRVENLGENSRHECPSEADQYEATTINEIFANSISKYGSRSCLGYRAVVTCPVLTLNEDGHHVLVDKSFRSAYTWYTYEQIGRRVQDIAAGLCHHSIYPGSRALFLANTCLEWFIAAQACFQIAAQLVVAPEISGQSSLASIIERNDAEVIFISCDRIDLLCRLFTGAKRQLIGATKMKKIIIIDWQFSIDFSEPLFASLRDASRHLVDQILSMGQIEETGVEFPIELSCTKALLSHLDANLDDEHGSPGGASPGESRKTSGSSHSSSYQDFIDSMRPASRRPIRRQTTDCSAGMATFSGDDSSLLNTGPSQSKDLDSWCLLPSGCAREPKPHDLAMIVYTHGPLGQLKGVAIDHQYLAKSCRRLHLDGLVGQSEVYCSLLPLDNPTELITEMSIFARGGSIGYSCSLETLFSDGKDLFKRDLSDLQALRPTLLLARPYILERLRASVHNHLALQMNPLKSFALTKVLYAYKRHWARRLFGTPLVDWLFCADISRLFGARLRAIMCDGLTDCSETRDFFALIVNIPIREIYGPEEAPMSFVSLAAGALRQPKGGGAGAGAGGSSSCYPLDGRLSRKHLRDATSCAIEPCHGNETAEKQPASSLLFHGSPILSPASGTRIRLDDWEDFRTDGEPHPSGQLSIGGDAVCAGYAGQPAAPTTGSSGFTVDSNSIAWFRTDQLARVNSLDGCIEIVSAISDMIKMSDGQLISLSQIEHILRNSQFVDNCCAICDTDRQLIVALVVPNLRRLALKSPGEANLKLAIGTDCEPDELTDIEFRREVCNDRLLCEFVADHLGKLVANAGLGSLPSRFHIVPEIWTPETELVTPSFEPKRIAVQKYYASDLQSLFRLTLDRSNLRLSARLLTRSTKYLDSRKSNQTKTPSSRARLSH